MSLIKLSNNGVKNITSVGSISTGDMVFIKKLTASSSATLSFVDGSNGVVLDDTYKEYVFTFKDIHSSGDSATFQFQCSTDGGSNYGVTLTSTFFGSYHDESDSATGLVYEVNSDLAQSTSFQPITFNGNQNDESSAGILHLYNPSSTSFVKHFTCNAVCNTYFDYLRNEFIAGYFNDGSNAIDGVQFKMASGNIDAGDICLYGIV